MNLSKFIPQVMNELLKQAKEILEAKRTDQAALDFMTKEQRESLANDYASQKQFLSAAHFTPDAEKRKEFERLFWENEDRTIIKVPRPGGVSAGESEEAVLGETSRFLSENL